MRIVECRRETGNGDHHSIEQTGLEAEVCSKHNLVFGETTQRVFSSLTIGIVAVGGLGILLIELLMRLLPLVLKFIDSDHVTNSNLNRLLGATFDDAACRLPKVELAARLISNFNPNQQFFFFKRF